MSVRAAADNPSNSSIETTFADLNIAPSVSPRPPPPRLTRRNIVVEFERYFGSANDLGNWQRLCHDVGIEGELSSIRKCKEALRGVWVNIYDLIDAIRENKTPPRRFKSQWALGKYTIKENKVYPKKKAKEGGPVRALLAHICH